KSFSGGDPEDLDGQLRELGLCTKNITGDGNCLFRSLSDQYYGHDGNHKAIRQEVCQYLRENEETYKFFVEDDQSFEHHVDCMSRDATFGGNMELVAFAKFKKVDIKVYQPGLIQRYIVNGVDEEEQDLSTAEEDPKQVLHIAYHSWEHYSSVRNINGPYTGPPEIKRVQSNEFKSEEQGQENEENEDQALTSTEKVVRNACPDTNIRKIKRLLIKYKGDPDKVIDVLYELEHKDEQKVGVASDNCAEKTVDQAAIESNQEIMTQEKETTENGKITPDANCVKLVDQAETVEKKAKKPSASERKKEAKKRQKEAKMLKEQAKAARKLKYKQEQTNPDHEDSNIKATTHQMKEMYI
ncbi:hypothetical protein CU098_009381, partial [Rhizopus stolonifer]